MPQERIEPRVTIDEYLRLERAAHQRHEYLDGEIIAMAGESGNHADVSTNVVGLLHAQLTGKDCRVRTKDTKIRSGPDRPHGSNTKGLFSYPDAVVICGEPMYHDEHNDVVLNPTVIVEVLSPSTEAFDRGKKFMRLRNWNPSLMDYDLISQVEPFIEVFHRTDASTWTMKESVGLEASAVLPAIECVLPLAEVYDRVDFSSAEGDKLEVQ
jgi:Uma2 family endonuclease